MNLCPLLLAAALPLASLADAAAAEPTRTAVAALSLDHLKTSYLACDRAATEAVLDPLTYQRCAMVGDELLQRGFGGDFERMIAWWRVEKQRFARGESESALRR